MVDSVATSADIMRANSQTFLYNLKTTNFTLKNATKAFLLENEGSVFRLETPDVDVTRVLVAQVLINLEEAVLKENLNEILFTDFSSFSTMSLEQNEDFQKNFPDLLICKLGKEQQLDEQSHILKSWMNIIKVNYKKIIFIVENPEHLKNSMIEIEMANIFKLKLDKLWKENEITTTNEAICEIKNDEANLNEQNEVNVNNESASARALDEDTNVNVIEEELGQMSLHDEATADDNADLVNFLQSLSVEDLDAVDKRGNNQLHLAALDGKTQIVESLLLAHGAKKNIQNNHGETALHFAAEKGHSAIVHMLLEHDGFNINATDNDQWTPLHNASFYTNDGHLIEILLKFGAEIEKKDKYGNTALHMASFYGHSAVVNSLLKHGADINTQDKNGFSPLHWATSRNRQEVVLILLEQEADCHIKNKWQQSVLDLARSQNYTNLIQIFEKHK